MRKVIILLVAISLILPALAFGGSTKEWSVGGVVKQVKIYGDDESHGYLVRIDVKRPNGKIKKVYVKKSTEVVTADGAKSEYKQVKTGKPVQIDYKKSGNDFVATKVTIL